MDEYEKGYSEGFQDGLQYKAENVDEVQWNSENFKNGWKEGFDTGLQEADKCVRKIFIERGFLNSTLFNLFGFYNPFEVLEHYSIKEIITRLEKYQKGEIKDECRR